MRKRDPISYHPLVSFLHRSSQEIGFKSSSIQSSDRPMPFFIGSYAMNFHANQSED